MKLDHFGLTGLVRSGQISLLPGLFICRPGWQTSGLSIVQAIAMAHGATLAAQARPQGGLHIEVSFPASDRPYDH